MIELTEENLLNDRYAVYENNRPCAWRLDRNELWLFEPSDCKALLDSASFSSRREGLANRATDAGFQMLGDFFRQWLMYTDGDEHLKRRSAVVRALRQIGLDIDVQQPSLFIEGNFDLIEEFCEPYVWHVLPQLLGLDSDERDFWKPRVSNLVALPGFELPELEVMRVAEVGLRELHEYLRKGSCKLLKALRTEFLQDTQPTDLINLAINVIGDGIHPTIAGLATEIFLRLTSEDHTSIGSDDLLFHREPPFQFAARIASQSTEVRDVAVDEGQRVIACLAAANRSLISSPMTFGHGRHACLGRMYAEKCIRSGLQTFARLSKGKTCVAGESRWGRSIGYRMIEEIAIQMTPQ